MYDFEKWCMDNQVAQDASVQLMFILKYKFSYVYSAKIELTIWIRVSRHVVDCVQQVFKQFQVIMLIILRPYKFMYQIWYTGRKKGQPQSTISYMQKTVFTLKSEAEQ